jgi:hypothetical protein
MEAIIAGLNALIRVGEKRCLPLINRSDVEANLNITDQHHALAQRRIRSKTRQSLPESLTDALDGWNTTFKRSTSVGSYNSSLKVNSGGSFFAILRLPTALRG